MRLHPRSWPIRWRLTALNVGVLAATLVVLGGALLLQLDNALVAITRDHLREQARPLLEPVQNPRGGLFGEPRAPGEARQPGEARPPAEARPGGEARPPGDARRAPTQPLGLSRAAPLLMRRLGGPETGVFLFGPDGGLVIASDPEEDLEAWPQPPSDLLAAALQGQERSLVVGQQSRRTLLLALPIRGPDGGVVGALALARSLELTEQVQARLQAILALGTLVALLVAGGLGLRATRAALRPLDEVIRLAREIGTGKLDQRLRLHRRDEIGALADALDAMLDRLANVFEAQRRFVADAAHELRTPLTALGGMVEMLQLGADRGDRATVQRMLDTMDREIGRLGRLVADLLTLSRLDSEQSLSLEPVELAPLLGEVASQAQLLSKGQRVETRILARPTVHADADRLHQVLLNLVDNALKFTPPDGWVELRLDQVGDQAHLEVADSGAGIAPDVLPTVMDRFVRGDPSRARASGGAGLGLAIARGIVEAHGGQIAITSQPGQGTTVSISLPLAPTTNGSATTSGNGQLSGVASSASTGML